MKKLSYLLLSVFITTLTACSKDDDNSSVPDDIFGKWTLSNMTMEGTFTEDGIEVIFTGKAKDIDENNYIVFKKDNKFEGKSTPIDMEITINILGQNYTDIIETGTNIPQSGTWERNGSKLIISAEGGRRAEYIIESFSSSRIVLTADENSIDLGDDFPSEAKFSVSITFKK